MTGGYESLVWLNDKEGREFVCSLEAIKSEAKSMESLSDEERARCMNVNELIGTERW